MAVAGFTAVGPAIGKALGHRFLSEHDSFMSAWNGGHLGSGGWRRDKARKRLWGGGPRNEVYRHTTFFLARADMRNVPRLPVVK